MGEFLIDFFWCLVQQGINRINNISTFSGQQLPFLKYIFEWFNDLKLLVMNVLTAYTLYTIFSGQLTGVADTGTDA